MDVRTVFRQLVLGQPVPDFDYKRTKFGFETVFHRNPYSYCICICGFEHEYLDYIKNSNDENKQSKESCNNDDNITSLEIDEEMYNKVVENIVNGYCPHVENAQTYVVEETYIYGVHVAAAVGSEAILNMRNLNNRIFSGLYELDPYGLALLKDSVVSTMPERIFSEDLGHRYLMRHFLGMFITNTRSIESTTTDTVKLEMKNIIEFCVAKADVQRLKSYLEIIRYDLFRNYPESVEALKLSYKLNLPEVTELLLQYKEEIRVDMRPDVCTVKSFVNLFIVLNEPKLLKKMLKHAHAFGYDFDLNMLGLLCICEVLQRRDCERLIVNAKKKTNIISKRDEMKISEREEMKLSLEFLLDDLLRDEIVAILQRMPDLPAFLNSGDRIETSFFQNSEDRSETWLHRCSNVQVMKGLFDLGLDINMTNKAHDTPFTDMLNHMLVFGGAIDRKIAELCIFQNPDPEVHESVFRYAILDDKNACKPPQRSFTDHSYQMDGELHGMFGHDGKTQFALNFTVPLFLECGLSIGNKEIVKVEQAEKDFDQAVVDYLKHHIFSPKPLAHISRNALRKHFKGRNIHKYVQSVDIPSLIKDMILVKPLLKNVPKELMEF